MVKILQARLQQHMKQEFPDVQAGFEEAEEPEIMLPSFVGSWGKQECSIKNIYFCLTDCAKTFDCVDYNKLWKILRDESTRLSYLSPAKCLCRSRRKLEQDVEQLTGLELGK